MDKDDIILTQERIREINLCVAREFIEERLGPAALTVENVLKFTLCIETIDGLSPEA